MNKKLNDFFLERGFEIKNNNAYGQIGNYDASVNVQMTNNVAPVQIQLVFFASDDSRRIIMTGLRDLKFKFFNFEFNLYGIVLGFNGVTVGSLLKNLPDMLDKITALIDSANVLGKGYCPVCGEVITEESKKYMIQWARIQMDERCVENLNAVIEGENEEFDNAPNNYLKGTLGALIGAVVGAVAYLILFELNFIAAISAFVAVYLGALLYKKFGGKPNKVMVVIVSALSILSQLFMVFYIYLGVAAIVAPEFGFFTTGMDAFKDMMTVAEFKTEFLTNFGMTAFFTVLGIGSYVVQLAKSTERQKSIR